MPVWFIIVTVVGFLWLLIESKWMTIRLLRC